MEIGSFVPLSDYASDPRTLLDSLEEANHEDLSDADHSDLLSLVDIVSDASRWFRSCIFRPSSACYLTNLYATSPRFLLNNLQIIEPVSSSDQARVQSALMRSFFSKQHLVSIAATKINNHCYIDDKNIYYIPNSRHLLDFAGQFFEEGEYLGIGLTISNANQSKKLMHPVTKILQNCDILYFTKKEDQIAFEKKRNPIPKSFKSPVFLMNIWYAAENLMLKRIEKQKKILENAREVLREKLEEWNYDDTFVPCATQELMRHGWKKEEAIKMHAIIFFHKIKSAG